MKGGAIIQTNSSANKKYKASMFAALFNQKERLISLYNAIHDTNYGLDTDIEINTLEDVLFMERNNDLSFTIDGRVVVLIEHQSTLNENMAIRFLIYIARVYEKIIDNLAIYKQKMVPVPKPEFYVFYNGDAEAPEEREMNLSDAFISLSPDERPNLDLTVKALNINYTKDAKVLKKDKTLEDYSYFVYLVERYRKDGHTLHQSIKKAVHDCVQSDKIKDFLESNGSEVENMLLTEWNWEDAQRVWREEAFADGVDEGKKKGKYEMFKSMFKLGIPIEKIAEEGKVNVSEVEKIVKS